MDEAVRAPNDRLAIIDVINGYGIAIDAADWERLADCFTPEAKVRYGNGAEFRGGAAVADFVKGATVGLTAQLHLLGNHEIALDGDRATASTYVHATQIQGEEGRRGARHGRDLRRRARADGGRLADRGTRDAVTLARAACAFHVAFAGAGLPFDAGADPARTGGAERHVAHRSAAAGRRFGGNWARDGVPDGEAAWWRGLLGPGREGRADYGAEAPQGPASLIAKRSAAAPVLRQSAPLSRMRRRCVSTASWRIACACGRRLATRRRQERDGLPRPPARGPLPRAPDTARGGLHA